MSYKEAMKKLRANDIANIYLVYGEEMYLAERFLNDFKKKLVPVGLEDLNLSFIEGKEFSLEKLEDACETLPFMAERKLVIVKDLEVFTSKKKNMSEEDEKALIKYMGKMPEKTSLVFYNSASIDARKKIVKTVQKQGETVNCEKLNPKDLKMWIEKKIKQYDKAATEKTLTAFMENIDYIGKTATQSLLDIENEIKKVVAYIGDQQYIEVEHIEGILTNNFQNDIFKLLDAVEKKQPREAIKRLNTMVYEGEPIRKIIATLGNQVRNLLKTKLLLEEGYTSKAIASKIGIHPFVATKCASHSKGFTIERLKELVEKFLQMDVTVKSGGMKEDIALELFIIEMCKESK
ncbi:MAG: DNA polymerase III subunit delta [Clostridiaceae bacterium]|nr:DNA polymerase III subunit delta [Clostridiaceae bacterium]